MGTVLGINLCFEALRRFMLDETGATALEYGFFVAFVAAALLAGAEYLANGVDGMFNVVRGQVTEKVDSN